MFNKALYLILSIAVLLSSSIGHSNENSLVHSINYKGKKITVEDINPYRNEVVKVKDPKKERFHTKRAYGSMWVTFMASMITTELVYCSNNLLPWIADNHETSTCRTELNAMLLDPGMNLGVLAMTATSIELNKRGNKRLKKLFKNMTGARKEKYLKLSQAMLSSLSMGAGMMVQTSIASSWNAPQMRKCFGVLKDGVFSMMESKGIKSTEELHERKDGEELVSNAMQKGHEKTPCVEAREHYFNAENGTASELYITVISLGISSTLAGGAFTTLRFAGLIMRANPAGLLMTGGMLMAQPVIEMIDRWLEPIIRAFYHENRSKRHASASFYDLMDSVATYEKSDSNKGNKLIGSYEETECVSFTKDDGVLRRRAVHSGCNEWGSVTKYGFGIKEAMESFNKNIIYRREGASNRFIETQGRWKEKLSNLYTTVSAFQKTMKLVYKIREANKSPRKNSFYYNTFAPLTVAKTPEEITKLNKAKKTSLFKNTAAEMTIVEGSKLSNILNGEKTFTSAQYKKLYDEVIKPLIKICLQINTRALADRHIYLERTLISLNEALHKKRAEEEIRIHLWRLKALFSDSFTYKYHTGFVSTTDNFAGKRFSKEEINEIKEKLTNAITSFTPNLINAHVLFEADGIPLLNEITYNKDDEEKKTISSKARKGMIQEQAPASQALVLMNKDDKFLFSPPENKNTIMWWDETKEYGFDSGKISSKIISHLVCGESKSGLDFFWLDGHANKMVLPNVLKNPHAMNCNYKTKHMPFKNYLPDEDYFYNPQNNSVKKFQTDEINHRIFKYAKKEHIGLPSVLFDPSTPLKWETFEEFDQEWKTVMLPKFRRFVLLARQEYFKSIDSYLDLFYDEPTCKINNSPSLRRQTSNNYCKQKWARYEERKISLNSILTDKEVRQRTKNYFTNNKYYSQIYTGDTFIDELRTYAYLAEKIFGKDNEHTKELTALIPLMYKTIHILDTEKRDFLFNIEDYSEDELLAKIKKDKGTSFNDILGENGVIGFVEGYKKIRTTLSQGLKELEEGANYEQIAPEMVTEEQAKVYIMYKIYKNLNSSTEHLYNVILKEYIGGASITYEGYNK